MREVQNQLGLILPTFAHRNTHKGSISPTFYARVFHTKFGAAFFYLCFSFVIFGAKILSEKRGRKMLLKLTQDEMVYLLY